jgi:amino acid adenylation domain-containing protein
VKAVNKKAGLTGMRNGLSAREKQERPVAAEGSAAMGKQIFQVSLQQSLKSFRDRVALACGHRFLSYGELDSRSAAVAAWLLQRGIEGNSLIGILMNDRIDLITVITGIIKAGSAIVPLYADYPDQRLETMIHSTDLKTIFIDGANFRRFDHPGVLKKQNREFIFLNEVLDEMAPLITREKTDTPGPARNYDPEDPLYLHFTSGTTGIPKAIVGKNKSLLHFLQWEIDTFQIHGHFHIAQFTIPGFDPFLRDVFAPLLAGGVVSIPAVTDLLLEAEALREWIDKQGIGLIHCVASLFRLLTSASLTAAHFKELKYILLAGEKINPTDLIPWYRVFGERIQLVNCYGPTETTMSKVYYLIRPEDVHRERIPIGKPIRGARVIILDGQRNLCDELEPGEIYIRTPFRSCGYYKAPELNEKHFIPSPFSDNPQDLIYKSGDLGRVLTDGNIDILGRVDRQVKIRGYRIELEEIETLMVKHPLVKEAVVIKKEVSPGNELLCGFIVENRDKSGASEAQNQAALEAPGALSRHLTDYLATQLPDYMVPVHIVKLERMPRKPNGKIDYDNLPDPLLSSPQEVIAPRSDLERQLLSIWSEFFAPREIGVTDNFFKLGGNSLNVMTMISKIHQVFEKRLTLGEVFLHPTIATLAQLLDRVGVSRYNRIEPAVAKNYYPLAPAQKRLYVLQQMTPSGTAYNIPRVVVLEEKPRRERLEEVFRQLTRRHESLRTSFVMVDNEPVQKIHPRVDVGIEEFGPDRQIPVDTIVRDFMRPFALEAAPLLRVGLIDAQGGKGILIVDLHHIIADGTSLEILVEEFARLYAGAELPLLRLQYKDYSEWWHSPLHQETLEKQEKYWLNQFTGGIPLLQLPTDFKRPSFLSSDGDVVDFELGAAETRALNKMALEEDVTLFQVLFAAYNILVARLSHQEDIVIGVPVAGRRHRDLETVIGMFVNTLALRNFPRGATPFGTFLKQVKQRTLEAFENQDYPFDHLVDKVAGKREPGRNPLFDVEFLLQNLEAKPVPAAKLKFTPYIYKQRTTKFDLSLRVVEVGEGLFFQFQYGTALFNPATIEKHAQRYVEILREVLENKEVLIKEIVVSHDLTPIAAELPGEALSDFGF